VDKEGIEMTDENKPKRKPRGFKIKPREKPKKVIIINTREPLKIGYMRVSTKKQDHALQNDALILAGVLPENIFKDTISGAKVADDGPGREACLAFLQPGDTLMVWKLDRFSRKLLDVLKHIEILGKKNIHFVSLTQNLDTSTSMGMAMVQIMAVFADLEREQIRERVKAGIAATRSEHPDMKWGKKPKVAYDESEVMHLLKKNTVRAVAKITGVPKSTIQQIKKRNQK